MLFLRIPRLEANNSSDYYPFFIKRKLLYCYILHVEKADNSDKYWTKSIDDNNVKDLSTLNTSFLRNSQILKIISFSSIHSGK